MRGNVWVELDVWEVSRSGDRLKTTLDRVYGGSAVQELNSDAQREHAFSNAVTIALNTYRNEHGLDYESEINYRVRGSGIQYVHLKTDEFGRSRVSSRHRDRISAVRKRMIHQQVFLGRAVVIKRSSSREFLTRDEYEGMKSSKTERYDIDTGTIHGGSVRTVRKRR